MGLGASLLLITFGAVLAFAVDAQISGLDVNLVGWILLVVGIIGGVISLLFWSSWGGVRQRPKVEQPTGPPPPP